MRGCLGTFIIFMLWTSICFYYVNTEGIGNTSNNSSIATIKNDTLNKPNKEQELIPSNSFIPINSTTNSITSYTHIDSIESKRIADEIEKSFSTSDTTHFYKEMSTPELKKEITTTNTILRPSYNDSELILNEELINFATELKEILEENPDKKVTIIGHTDSIGSSEDNLTDGLKKARQVRWYLTAKRSISTSKITAISKGEDNPIEDNTTSVGREKNNRIEIIIN